jgi:nucleoid DNA-binding protein
MEVMKQAILNGNRIEIRSFGVFETRPKKRGFGRDIRGGKTILIEEGTSVRFKPGKALRELPMKPSKKG